jgi:hypothetical protein
MIELRLLDRWHAGLSDLRPVDATGEANRLRGSVHTFRLVRSILGGFIRCAAVETQSRDFGWINSPSPPPGDFVCEAMPCDTASETSDR